MVEEGQYVLVTTEGCEICEAVKEDPEVSAALESGEMVEIQEGDDLFETVLLDLGTAKLPAFAYYTGNRFEPLE